MKNNNSVREKNKDFLLEMLPLGVKERLLSLKRFGLFGEKRHPNSSLLIFLVDGREIHGGLADRFKGMVSAFCIAQVTHRAFRIDHHSPFPLEAFLEPNSYDWRIKESDRISYSIRESRLIHLKDGQLADNLKRIPGLDPKIQLHCYCQGEFFLYLKKRDGNVFDFAEEFKDSSDLILL